MIYVTFTNNMHDVYNVYEVKDNMSLRKNITISEEDYEIIMDYCRKAGTTFSEFLREAALFMIKKNEEMDLYSYLVKNTDYVDEQEQAEFNEMNIDSEANGRELTLDDVL